MNEDLAEAQRKVDDLAAAERQWNARERRRGRYFRIKSRRVVNRIWTVFFVCMGVSFVNSVVFDARAVQDHVDFLHENQLLCAAADNREVIDKSYNQALRDDIQRLAKRHPADADLLNSLATTYAQRRDASKTLRMTLCPTTTDVPKVIASPTAGPPDGAQRLFGGLGRWVKSHF